MSLSVASLVDTLFYFTSHHNTRKSFNNKPKNVIKFHLKRDFSSFPLNFRNLSLCSPLLYGRIPKHCWSERWSARYEKSKKNRKKKCWKISLSYYRYYKKYTQNMCWDVECGRAKTQHTTRAKLVKKKAERRQPNGGSPFTFRTSRSRTTNEYYLISG